MEKDIMKILRSYLRYWYLFLIGGAICVALAFLYIRYEVVPQYYISGKILLNDKEQGNGASGTESLSNLGLIKMSRNIQDEIGVFQSYDLMAITLEELGLGVGYYAQGRFGDVELYGEALPFKVQLYDSLPILQYGKVGNISILDEQTYKLDTFDSEDQVKSMTYNFGKIISTPSGSFSVEWNSNDGDFISKAPISIVFRNVENMAMGYSQNLTVFPVSAEGGGLLEVSLTDAIPQRGVDLINKHIEVYARKSAENKNVLANTTLELVDQRLELLTGELGNAERDVEVFKRSNNLTNVEADASRFVTLADEASRELITVRAEIDAIKSLEMNVEQSNLESSSVVTSFNIQNPSLISLLSKYNEQLYSRKAMIRNTGQSNPLLVELDRQLRDMKTTILNNVQSIKSSLLKTERDILNKSNQYKSKISSVPTAERTLFDINRDQSIKQQLYLYLLQKREEEALSISAPFSDTRIIETPRSTSYPISPNKTSIYLGAMLFGLFVPFVFVFVKQNLNTKVGSTDDIKALTDTMILGSIASSKHKETIVVSENNVSAASELFRLMRFNLKFISKGEDKQVIMVTSGKKGEGKTFISVNLGASLAITGKKVVVLGFDLRAPRLMKDVGLQYKHGITDYIVDRQVEVTDIIVRYKGNPNLDFIASGTIPPNPGELMLSDRVSELIAILKQTYDYIIIDTPPIGKVADAFSLRNYVDSTLYIVRSNYTTKSEIKGINDITLNKKLDQVMIVFNDVKFDKSSTYGYGEKLGK
ncbi:GumC family protein [Confluentibacter sediminis]|uniref:GumC family protein n=1 Tax=Confluentibacter sediminis TaxID=2219045 RepID=UPI000DAE37C7|nr:tyrosine-protein kinase [Confluentibacter sediminis]